VAGVGAVVLSLQADGVTQGQGALTRPRVEGPVIPTIHSSGHQSGAHEVAHVVLLAVVGIGEDALRGALEVALDPEWMTGSCFVGAAPQSGIAVVPIGHVAGLHRDVHPSIRMTHTGGQQLAGFADGSRTLAALTGVRLPRLNASGGHSGSH